MWFEKIAHGKEKLASGNYNSRNSETKTVNEKLQNVRFSPNLPNSTFKKLH